MMKYQDKWSGSINSKTTMISEKKNSFILELQGHKNKLKAN